MTIVPLLPLSWFDLGATIKCIFILVFGTEQRRWNENCTSQFQRTGAIKKRKIDKQVVRLPLEQINENDGRVKSFNKWQ